MKNYFRKNLYLKELVMNLKTIPVFYAVWALWAFIVVAINNVYAATTYANSYMLQYDTRLLSNIIPVALITWSIRQLFNLIKIYCVDKIDKNDLNQKTYERCFNVYYYIDFHSRLFNIIAYAFVLAFAYIEAANNNCLFDITTYCATAAALIVNYLYRLVENNRKLRAVMR